jgi:hypothetical protein
LSRFVSAWPCPVKPFSSKKQKKQKKGPRLVTFYFRTLNCVHIHDTWDN